MDELEVIRPILEREFLIELSHTISIDEMREALALHINHLINHRFDELLSLLYRIDINEHSLRFLLHEHRDEDAGKLIAGMIIERQLQKIRTRKDFDSKQDIPDEEKW